MRAKVIARAAFEVLVEECASSRYGNMEDDSGWYFSAARKLYGLGVYISTEEFTRARMSLLNSGFVKRTNIKCTSKYSRGFFVVRPTTIGIKRLIEVCV